MSDRPSFVLFITDQQQARMLGCAGDPVLQTPNIDAIAATGTRFDRFHVAMPSCMPNRASILTSLYPSVNGVRFNGIPLPRENVTFPELFHDAGYRTGLMGKGHLQPILEPYPEQGATSEVWWRQELEGRGNGLTAPYYGYDAVSIVTGHGDACGGHYETWLKDRLPDYQDYLGPENQLPHNYSCPQAVRSRLPEEYYPTTYIADQALAFLDEQADSDQPFLLVVSFPDPHHPFNPPGEYWGMYDPDDIPLPDNFDAPDSGLPHLAAARAARGANCDNRDGYGAIALAEREAREAIALTYGMITMIDDAIGRVRQKLADQGLDDNTVQIFTSDHGDLLGDHGLMLKGPLHYQNLVRVPFVMSDPFSPSQGAVNSDLFSGVDIGVSLLDRAGISGPETTHGISIFEVASGDLPARTGVLIEDEYQSPVLCFDTAPTLRTFITQRWRLTVFEQNDWGELYDLENDPGEVTNLWFNEEYAAIKSTLLSNVVSEMMASTDRRMRPKSLA